MTGRHLTIDGWATGPDGKVDSEVQRLLDDRDHLAAVLDDLVALVGMQILKPAELLAVPLDATRVDGDEDCGGSTGVVVLTTSHASLHTWPLRGQVSFDLYSCREFDTDAALGFLADRLRLTGGTVRSLPRFFDPKHRHGFVCDVQ